MPYKKTIDHEEIKLWVESHGGHPAALRMLDGDVGVVRFDYKPYLGAQHPLSWTEFFQQFENRNLAFLYDDEAPPGLEESAAKLVNRGS